MEQTERTLSIIAALITITNFIILLPNGSSIEWVPVEIISSLAVPTKLVLVAILELSLAYAFGIIFSLSCKLDELHRFLVYMIASFCSAWLSVFNLEILLVSKITTGVGGFIGLALMLIVAFAIAATMIEGHLKRVVKTDVTKKVQEAINVQGIAYVFIFISLIFR